MAERKLRLAALALGAPLDARMRGVLGRYFLDPPDASLARLHQMAVDAGLAGEVEPSLAAAGDLASQLADVQYLLVESAEITDAVLARGAALKLVQKHGEDVRNMRGLTLGLVGLGEIGRDVARKAASFRMPALYTQRRRLTAALEVTLGAEFLALPELLEASDVVSLHVPLTAETRGMIGARELARMRPGAILVNTSRGSLVKPTCRASWFRPTSRPGRARS